MVRFMPDAVRCLREGDKVALEDGKTADEALGTTEDLRMELFGPRVKAETGGSL